MLNIIFHCHSSLSLLAKMLFINKSVIFLWSAFIELLSLRLYLASYTLVIWIQLCFFIFIFITFNIMFYWRLFYTADAFLAVCWLIIFHIVSSPTAFHSLCSINTVYHKLHCWCSDTCLSFTSYIINTSICISAIIAAIMNVCYFHSSTSVVDLVAFISTSSGYAKS